MLRGLFSIKAPPRFLFSSFKPSPFPTSPKRPFYSSPNGRSNQKQTKTTKPRPIYTQKDIDRIKAFGKEKWEKIEWWKRNIILLVGGAGVIWFLTHIDRVPVSGRWRYHSISLAYEIELGDNYYKTLLRKHEDTMFPEDHEDTRQVEEMGRRLVATSPTLQERNYEWVFHVIDEPNVNAFVLPNGKCFVYKGLLDLCESEDEAAVILGHEVAHVIARHSGERLSNRLLRLVFSFILVFILDVGVDWDVLNYGGEIMMGLPQSRRNETEADQIGLILAKRAGYDLKAAITIWEKMSKGDKKHFDILSTHPAHPKRIKNIRKFIDKLEQKPQLVYQNKV